MHQQKANFAFILLILAVIFAIADVKIHSYGEEQYMQGYKDGYQECIEEYHIEE